MKTILAILFLLTTSCAVLHHVQVGDIDNRQEVELKEFEIKVSETGIDLGDVKAMSNILMNQKSAEQANEYLSYVQMFQMGPVTGAGVYSIEYTKNLERAIREKCPSGAITGLISIRETRKYPVISGEIVKIKGYCAQVKGKS